MDELIRQLPPEALRVLADYLAAAAAKAKSKVIERDISKDRDREHKRLFAHFRQTGQDVLKLVKGGMSEQAAIATIAAEAACPPLTVEAYYKKAAKADARAMRAARDRRIVALAARGWPNARIGAEVGLSPGYVSKIVQAAMKKPPV